MSGKIPSYRLVQLFVTTLISVVLFGCGGSDSPQEDTFTLVQSSHGAINSHNMGDNCLQSGCHGASNAGPAFTLAGTVYTNTTATTTYPDVDVEIVQNGNVIKTIQVNSKGNFYTNDSISWGSNLTARVVTQNGSSIDMPAALASSNDGGCNQSNCHVAGLRIYGP